MTNATRKLSAEMRQHTTGLTSVQVFERYCMALHDLDVADREHTLDMEHKVGLLKIIDSQRESLAAAQATIAQQSRQLAERLEDVVVLSDKLKFAEMDIYAKDSVIEDLNQRIKDQAQKLTQQRAVIAAMRETLGELHATVKGECPGLLNEDCGGNARLDLSVEAALADTAQLAAEEGLNRD